MSFTKLLWCQRAKVLIGYQQNDDTIWLMSSLCVIYQIVRNEFRINSMFYNPDTNEAVVAGLTKVTVKRKSFICRPLSPSITLSFRGTH